MSSEDEARSTVKVPSGDYNTAIVLMEPATLARSVEHHQDTVRWRLSVEQTIELVAGHHSPAETITASLATITLPPVHHARQAVAIWYWPLWTLFGFPGRITELTFRWESDSARASAETIVIASEGVAGTISGMCGLFALPFPGPTDVLQPFGRFGR